MTDPTNPTGERTATPDEMRDFARDFAGDDPADQAAIIDAVTGANPDRAPEPAKAPRKAPAKAATKAATKAPRKAPRKAPEPEPVVTVRAYNPWVAPQDRKAAQAALSDPHGITEERARAAERVKRNITRYPLSRRKDGTAILWAPGAKGPDGKAATPAPQLAQSLGWHDRTVTKVLTAMATSGATAPALAKVRTEAAAVTGYGTARAFAPAGVVAFAQAAQAATPRTRKAPARKAATA